MAEVLAALVPGAVGLVLVNPLPIIAIIVLMLAPNGHSRAFAFLAGWAAGLVALLAVLVWVVPLDELAGGKDTPSDLASVVRLGLGLLLLALAVKKWRTRAPADGEPPAPPKWMRTLEQASAVTALGIGAALAGVNPKNFAFTIPAAITIATAELPGLSAMAAILVFMVIASLGVLAPILIHQLGGAPARARLTNWRDGLTRHYNVIMMVVFIIFGITLVSRGLGDLLP